MAQLKVSDVYLLQALFPDLVNLDLRGASYDPESRLLLLDIAGPNVPDAEQVTALITVERRTTKFEAIK